MGSSRHAISWTVLCVASVLGACAPKPSATDGLGPGSVVVGTVAGDGPVEYALASSPPVFVKAVLEPRGLDLGLELRDGRGTVLAASEDAGASWVPRVLSCEIDRADGPLTLVVLGPPALAAPSTFELRIEELRVPEAGDAERSAIDRLVQSGLAAAARSSPEGLDASLELFAEAAGRAAKLHDLRREAQALQRQAEVLLWTDRDDEALAAARTARDRLADAPEAPRLRAAVLAVLADALSHAGEAEEAERVFAEAEALTSQPLVATYRPAILRRRAEHAYRQGDRQEAEAFLGEGLEACALGPCNPREELLLLTDQGAVQRFFGRYTSALEHYRRALEVVDRLHDESSRALVLNNLGVVHATRGEAAEALTYYREAAELAPLVGRASTAATATGNMGLLLSFLGDLDRALEYARRSLELHREIGSERGEAIALMQVGWVRERRLELDDAMDSFDDAIELSRRVGDRHTEALALVGRARALTAGDAPDRALEAVDRSLLLLEELGDVSGKIEALRARGEALLELEELDPAEAALSESLELAVAIGDAGREAPLRALLSRSARKRGDLGTARELIERSLDLRESVRAALASPTLRASYQSHGLDDYLEYVDLLLAAGREAIPEAFEAAERAKARMLVELLAEAQVEVDRGVPPALLEERAVLVGELSAAQLELRRLIADGSAEGSDTLAQRQGIAGLQEGLEALEWRIRRSNPRYAELRYPEVVALDDARELLDSETVLLEFALGEPRSYLFAVTRDRAEVHLLPSRSDLQPIVSALRKDLEAGGRRGLARLDLHRAKLYDLLLRPAEELIDGRGALVIIPDQELLYVPFESLVDASRRRRTVVSTWSVSYAPSATALARIRQRGRTRQPPEMEFVGFADPAPALPAGQAVGPAGLPPAPGTDGLWPPLPEARREIAAISRLFPARSRAVFFGSEATESAVKTAPAMRRASRIHFAAHTVIDTRRPGYSALVLSPGASTEDGFLQVHEIFELDLDARLVVLSGCRTGLGTEIRGEGLVGMTQAFFYAGTDALLVSLWPVPDDSTAELMVAVYESLRADVPLDRALQEAKLALLERTPYRHPYYWSAFVLVGERT